MNLLQELAQSNDLLERIAAALLKGGLYEKVCKHSDNPLEWTLTICVKLLFSLNTISAERVVTCQSAIFTDHNVIPFSSL